MLASALRVAVSASANALPRADQAQNHGRASDVQRFQDISGREL
jgi:hypothetical protein